MVKTKYLKLPFSFDVERLKEDLGKVSDDDWVAHFNVAAYEKRWSCAPLRSVDGLKDHIVSAPNGEFRDTEILDRCPYFREVIDSFQCEKTSVRLMSLAAGGLIRQHTDHDTSFEDGMIRLHIPIMTDPEVIFNIGGEGIHFTKGDTWYINAYCMHGVKNGSDSARVHLMLDCPINPWLEKVFNDAGFIPNDKPKYGDPSITDENVDAIISVLREAGTEGGDKAAEDLLAIKEG